LRIAIANTARNYGGQEAMAAVLAEQLQARSHDVVFLCRPVFPALERLQSRVAVEPVLRGIDWDPRSIWRARKVLQRHGVQVMLVTTNKDMRSAALAAWSLGVPVVVRRAMARPLRGTPHYRFLYGVLPQHIVTNSHATRKILLDSAPWIDPEHTSVIHNGIDPRPFREAEPAELGIPPGALVIGFVGRFVEWKGVLTVAEAWKRVVRALPDAHLALVGEGEMEAEMRALLADVDRVQWVGFRRDVPSIMRSLDVLAFPSTMEGFGLAAVEAMAASVPVVGARAAALPEVLNDGVEGLLIPPRDPAALADALLRLGRDPELRQRMGRLGQARVERQFSLDRMLDAYEGLIESAAER
jgi:glycosyltransferase involved in cell wall biosynthesis